MEHYQLRLVKSSLPNRPRCGIHRRLCSARDNNGEILAAKKRKKTREPLNRIRGCYLVIEQEEDWEFTVVSVLVSMLPFVTASVLPFVGGSGQRCLGGSEGRRSLFGYGVPERRGDSAEEEDLILQGQQWRILSGLAFSAHWEFAMELILQREKEGGRKKEKKMVTGVRD
ncbi:hypothetical protein Dimus_026883, partial [Dionaea muscipula]